ncbi:MAG: ABC transporter ATP-binding protein, partial [Chloroflexi bacterium]|nr:ABC transporter ATP-binding protein [Chloroflexota bacterium]
EADALCERIAVIDHGNIVALDTPAELKKDVQDLSVIEVEVFGLADEMFNKVRSLSFVDNVAIENREQTQVLMVQTTRGSEAIPDLMNTLEGVRIGKVTSREPTLEDAYIRLVGGDE